MNPKTFLMWGGIILVVLAVVGFLGLNLGQRVLWFDAYENWAHLILGVVAIAAAYRLAESGQRTLVWIVGVVALVVGVWGSSSAVERRRTSSARTWRTPSTTCSMSSSESGASWPLVEEPP